MREVTDARLDKVLFHDCTVTWRNPSGVAANRRIRRATRVGAVQATQKSGHPTYSSGLGREISPRTCLSGSFCIAVSPAFGSAAYIAYHDGNERMKQVSSNLGQQRSEIHPGQEVDIVLKKDQATGALTRGIVKDILTNSPTHPHGIKVRLQDGKVGRVKGIIGQ